MQKGLVTLASNADIGDFRFEYEIEYENDFSILDFYRLRVIKSHTRLIPWTTLST